MTKSWTLDVKQLEDGDYFIEFNDEILAETGWKEGDKLEWINLGDGSWKLEKLEETETELVLVDCISTFRMRYVVEVPKGKSEWALDTVTMNEAKEFSQEHIGEQIVSHRVITKDEAIRISDVDNYYCKTWSDDKKIDTFVTLRKDYE